MARVRNFKSIAAAAVCAAIVSSSAFGIMKEFQGFRAPHGGAKEAVKGFLWLEAENFSDYGEWRLDTQFTHKMGSAYLVAAGVLKPLKPATTRVDFPKGGVWRVWARTKDWLPEYHPGKFKVSVAGKPGRELGASGKDGWRWEFAGEWELPAGEADVSLVDLTGAFARCDALLFTQDAAYVPPDGAAECAAAAAEMLKDGLMPREYAADPKRIRRLQQLLLKDDLYIPKVVNEDPEDLARTAKVSATSTVSKKNSPNPKDKVHPPAPERVIDGISRDVGIERHCWVSDPAKPLPQALTLEFAKPVTAEEVRITFDSDLNPLHPRGNPLPPTLAKAYAVEVFDGREWTTIATEKRNRLRLMVHKFSAREIEAVRIRIDETWGNPAARIFEVRVY